MTANVFVRGQLTCIKCSGDNRPKQQTCISTQCLITPLQLLSTFLAQEMQQITTLEKQPRQRERKVIYKA